MKRTDDGVNLFKELSELLNDRGEGVVGKRDLGCGHSVS